MLINVLDNLSRSSDESDLLTIPETPGAVTASLDSAAAAEPDAAPSAGPLSLAPSHCGAPMEWTVPALAAMSAYSFDSGAAPLPPVWRCSCGFQLDGIVHISNALAALS